MNMDSNPRLLGLLGLGAAVGILAGRFAPSAGAISRSPLRARMMRDPFSTLIQDHRKIVKTLREMERSLPDEKLQRTKQFLLLKRRVGKHAMAEEDVVYPVLQTELGDEEAAKHLFAEHGEIKVRLFRLENLLKSDEDWRSEVRSLREFMEEHMRQEEEVEFPRIRRALSREKSKEISQAVSREEALVL